MSRLFLFLTITIFVSCQSAQEKKKNVNWEKVYEKERERLDSLATAHNAKKEWEQRQKQLESKTYNDDSEVVAYSSMEHYDAKYPTFAAITPEGIADTFMKWYVNQVYLNSAVDFELTTSIKDDSLIYIDYTAYFNSLRRFGSFSDVFFRKEIDEIYTCDKLLATIDPVKLERDCACNPAFYLGIDDSLGHCTFLLGNFWLGGQGEPVDHIEHYKTYHISQDSLVVEMIATYKSINHPYTIYSYPYLTFRREGADWKITDISYHWASLSRKDKNHPMVKSFAYYAALEKKVRAYAIWRLSETLPKEGLIVPDTNTLKVFINDLSKEGYWVEAWVGYYISEATEPGNWYRGEGGILYFMGSDIEVAVYDFYKHGMFEELIDVNFTDSLFTMQKRTYATEDEVPRCCPSVVSTYQFSFPDSALYKADSIYKGY